ncbi:hypothetical protein CEXT_7901 [Caerostris extrusa]|uniref:Uncharacterized protein n=1 Tax=Caerostris extrusa TaxID=172846 RepID=A0AAV4PUN5_CAEEX|nr:hypothetical protein CEXT_7901 [Caerostris extrusa]
MSRSFLELLECSLLFKELIKSPSSGYRYSEGNEDANLLAKNHFKHYFKSQAAETSKIKNWAFLNEDTTYVPDAPRKAAALDC